MVSVLATSTLSVPSVNLAAWDFSGGNCSSSYLQDGTTYQLSLPQWTDQGDTQSMVLTACWNCYVDVAQGPTDQGWNHAAGAVIRDGLGSNSFYDQWTVHVDPTDEYGNLIQLYTIGSTGSTPAIATMYMGAGGSITLPDGDNWASSAIQTMEPFHLRYSIMANCAIRFYVEGKGTITRCGPACAKWTGIISIENQGNRAVVFWGTPDGINTPVQAGQADFTATPV